MPHDPGRGLTSSFPSCRHRMAAALVHRPFAESSVLRGSTAMKSTKTVRGLVSRAPLATAIAFGLLAAPAAQAFEFQKGGLTGSLDTTVSYGVSVRTEDADPDLIGKAYFNPLICTQNAVGTVVIDPTAAIP